MNRRRNPREAKGQNAQNLEPSDSLVDSVTNVLSGGMGEKKTKSEESHEIFADDETEQQQPPVRASVDSLKNKCARCRVELSTKARYCRACYEGRAIWMPPRPTRKKRPNPRLKRIGEKRNGRLLITKYVNSLTRRRDQTDEGFLSLRHRNLSKTSSSSVTSDEFAEERRTAWSSRRTRSRKIQSRLMPEPDKRTNIENTQSRMPPEYSSRNCASCFRKIDSKLSSGVLCFDCASALFSLRRN